MVKTLLIIFLVGLTTLMTSCESMPQSSDNPNGTPQQAQTVADSSSEVSALDQTTTSDRGQTTDQILAQALADQTSDIQVKGQGKVKKILPDDRDGSQHQKFILELNSGQTILVAHNIDLAPRIDALKKGDLVKFNGEYEWNDLGGILHWTHHDPDGNHEDGWLEHQGQKYQ
jgi:hypothetical protein